MNIGEALAVQAVIREMPEDAAFVVRDQLAMLADRSRKVLAAGISGDQVRKATQEWFDETRAAVPLRVSTSRRGSA